MLRLGSSGRVGSLWGTASRNINGHGEGLGGFPEWKVCGLELNPGINVELTVRKDRQFKGAV